MENYQFSVEKLPSQAAEQMCQSFRTGRLDEDESATQNNTYTNTTKSLVPPMGQERFSNQLDSGRLKAATGK